MKLKITQMLSIQTKKNVVNVTFAPLRSVVKNILNTFLPTVSGMQIHSNSMASMK